MIGKKRNHVTPKQKYYPPTFDQTSFHCALCRVYAKQSWFQLFLHFPGQVTGTQFKASLCFHCNNCSYWYEGKMIVPSSVPVEPPHEDLPVDCRSEYDEARDIFARSPRGAAALLRLCVQKLMPHIGEKGKNINDDIAVLVTKGLPVEVQQALDFCRVVGNHAVHPGEIQLDDTPEMAQKLFQMINFIVENRISRPKEIKELFDFLPPGAKDAIAKRDKGASG